MRNPFEHQRTGLVWAGDRRRIALFWEMRLGKSLVAIRWATQWNTPTLVVCPNDLLEGWLEELQLEGKRAVQVRGFSAEVPTNVRWVVCSYETLRGNVNLQWFPWGCVILDESIAIKEPRAKITKTVLRCFKRTAHKAILTGLPAPEKTSEYITQMLFLHGSFLGCRNYWDIRAKYFKPSGYDWEPNAGVNARMIEEMNRYSHVLTRQQAGMGGVFVKQSRRIDMPSNLRSVYNEAERLFELKGEQTNWRPVIQTWLARLAGGCHPAMPSGHKLEALHGLLTGDLKNQQVVVWFTFNSEIEAVAAMIEKTTDLDYGIIKGDVKNTHRAKINHAFQHGKLDVLLCQTKCARYGRNFSAAEAAVYFSLPWDLNSYLQSRDRVIHPEKQAPTLAINLLARDSVDEDVFSALTEKRNVALTFKALIGKNLCERLKGKR